ncbi:haloacid dehalogenase type II [Dongia sp.]|uniref:haloacid dehalogenase type II n=1 Tax=Dongia sp. TaxID=1977262 RepID=UPI003751A87C
MRLTDFKVLTFDCYGTLIDWESGILAALRPLLKLRGGEVEDNEVLELYARYESAIEADEPTLNYRKVLAKACEGLALDLVEPVTEAEAARFGNSVPDWPAFADSAAALAYLKQHYKLVILSNIDRASFAESNKKLGVTFDAICTAEDIGSYKPDKRNFDFALKVVKEKLGFEPKDILHTAQSLFHDHQMAKQIGLATNWIDRRMGKSGSGATAPVEGVTTDFHFPSMAAFVEAHRKE